MPTPFGRSHCPLQSGYFDSSCAAALVIAVANARNNAIAPVGLWRGCMATSEEHASKPENTTHPRQGERVPRQIAPRIAHRNAPKDFATQTDVRSDIGCQGVSANVSNAT